MTAIAAQPAIRVQDLQKAYGRLRAVDGVSFEVPTGQVFGLLGPNGAGKTTTVEMLEGLTRPDAGTAEVLGLNSAKDADQLKQRIGVQLQTAALYPNLTVAEVIDLFRSFYTRTRPTNELIESLDLGEKRNAQTRHLSGGQRQRLSVALALVNDPELVFLDEPTTGLDPAARRSLWDLIAGMRDRGKTVLLTTHYLEEAETLCDRVAIMDHGKILEIGTVDELVGRRFRERSVRFDAIPQLSDTRLVTLPGVSKVGHEEGTVSLSTGDVAATIGALLALTESIGADPANLSVRRATLEDVFLDLTGSSAARLRSSAMKSLLNLTRANVKSFVRDRAALFWTIAFPLIFIVLFGTIYSSGGNAHYKIGWVDEDGSAASAQLHDAFASVAAFNLVTGTSTEALAAMRTGDVASVIIVPKGYGAAAAAAAKSGASTAPGASGAGSPTSPPVQLTLYVDPSQQTDASAMNGIVSAVVGRVNQGDRPTFVGVQTQAIEAVAVSGTAYFVPSILAMAIMQLGLFGAIPLVQQRQKLILKRLNATPLRRWTLVGSNVLMRLFIGVVQTLLIVGVGAQLFNVSVVGNPIEVALIVGLGSLMFISLGYVVASFAPTEESANMITSILQFPLMFLSGIFFPLALMPDWLRTIAALLPLTYLGDALRQVMVGGTPFAPLAVSVAILAGWLVACFAISARFFKWQ